MAAGMRTFVPGNFGVTLFFFLSGYLITTLMRLELERTGRLDFRRFYARRALRIFPTCYAVLMLAAVYGFYAGTTDPWWFLGQMAHLTNYLIIAGGWTAPIAPNTDVYWSLAVEEHFYLAFPLAFVFLARARPAWRRAALLGGLCAVILAWRCWLALVAGAPDDRTYLATDTRMDSILLGCILGVWGNPALDRTRIDERIWKHVLLPAALLVLLATFLVPQRAFRESLGYTLQGLCLFPIFVVAVRYPGWGAMRLLNWHPVQYLGVLSYAIYLVHPSMIHLSRELAGQSRAAYFVVAAALTFGAAAVLYHAIERPLSGWRRRLSPLEERRAELEPLPLESAPRQV